MKSMTKIISVCLVVLTLMMVFVSCGLSAADVAGSYYCKYTYNGNEFEVTITLDEDMNYTKNTIKNVCRLAREGMKDTDREILNIMMGLKY